MENTENAAETPRKVDILVDALTKEESSSLRAFILEKTINNNSIDLPYRPDEWDADGIIQKIQDLAKEHIKHNFVTNNQLEPRRFTLINIEDSDEYGEEYSEYNQDAVISYKVMATVSNEETCSGGSTVFPHNGKHVDHLDGTTITIHRCERINDWNLSDIYKGQRLDLAMEFQDVGRRISYNYHIEQTTEDLLGF